MIRGIYASRTGMAVEQLRTDILANNLANINTTGFKRSAAVAGEFQAMLLQRMEDPTDAAAPTVGLLGNGAAVEAVLPYERQGDITETGRSLDLAIEGTGYFLAQKPDGSLHRTRNGAFRQAADGTVVTAEGFPLLLRDPDGGLLPLRTPGSEPQFGVDGTVSAGGQTVGDLAMEGATLETRLHLKSLEASNVELAKEMADVIVTLRSFQINQRALQIQDQTLGRATTEIGKV